MTIDVMTVACLDCHVVFERPLKRRGKAQVYCSSCGARRLLENARRYQAKRRALLKAAGGEVSYVQGRVE